MKKQILFFGGALVVAATSMTVVYAAQQDGEHKHQAPEKPKRVELQEVKHESMFSLEERKQQELDRIDESLARIERRQEYLDSLESKNSDTNVDNSKAAARVQNTNQVKKEQLEDLRNEVVATSTLEGLDSIFAPQDSIAPMTKDELLKKMEDRRKTFETAKNK